MTLRLVLDPREESKKIRPLIIFIVVKIPSATTATKLATSLVTAGAGKISSQNLTNLDAAPEVDPEAEEMIEVDTEEETIQDPVLAVAVAEMIAAEEIALALTPAIADAAIAQTLATEETLPEVATVVITTEEVSQLTREATKTLRSEASNHEAKI